MTFSVLVEVRLRDGIADPEGSTVERSLPALGFEGIEGVICGRSIYNGDLDFAAAQARADEIGEQG